MIPTTVVDNFFKDPDNISSFIKSLEFTDANEKYPGLRTKCLSEIDYGLYNSIVTKVLGIFYTFDNINVNYKTHLFAQKVDSKYKKGWVHNDYPAIFTFVIYLNKKYPLDAGTSIYRLKNEYLTYTTYDILSQNIDLKEKSFKDTSLINTKDIDNNNNFFEETINISNVYNRMIAFDAQNFHAQNNLNYDEERITLVGFVEQVNNPATLPLPRINSFINI